MHCLATNACVWVRTLVRESLKEINGHMSHYEKAQSQFDASATISDTFLHQVAEAVAAVVGNNEAVSNEGSSSSELGINSYIIHNPDKYSNWYFYIPINFSERHFG